MEEGLSRLSYWQKLRLLTFLNIGSSTSGGAETETVEELLLANDSVEKAFVDKSFEGLSELAMQGIYSSFSVRVATAGGAPAVAVRYGTPSVSADALMAALPGATASVEDGGVDLVAYAGSILRCCLEPLVFSVKDVEAAGKIKKELLDQLGRAKVEVKFVSTENGTPSATVVVAPPSEEGGGEEPAPVVCITLRDTLSAHAALYALVISIPKATLHQLYEVTGYSSGSSASEAAWSLMLFAAAVSFQRRKGEGQMTMRIPLTALEQTAIFYKAGGAATASGGEFSEEVSSFLNTRKLVECPETAQEAPQGGDESDEDFVQRTRPKSYVGLLKGHVLSLIETGSCTDPAHTKGRTLAEKKSVAFWFRRGHRQTRLLLEKLVGPSGTDAGETPVVQASSGLTTKVAEFSSAPKKKRLSSRWYEKQLKSGVLRADDVEVVAYGLSRSLSQPSAPSIPLGEQKPPLGDEENPPVSQSRFFTANDPWSRALGLLEADPHDTGSSLLESLRCVGTGNWRGAVECLGSMAAKDVRGGGARIGPLQLFLLLRKTNVGFPSSSSPMPSGTTGTGSRMMGGADTEEDPQRILTSPDVPLNSPLFVETMKLIALCSLATGATTDQSARQEGKDGSDVAVWFDAANRKMEEGYFHFGPVVGTIGSAGKSSFDEDGLSFWKKEFLFPLPPTTQVLRQFGVGDFQGVLASCENRDVKLPKRMSLLGCLSAVFLADPARFARQAKRLQHHDTLLTWLQKYDSLELVSPFVLRKCILRLFDEREPRSVLEKEIAAWASGASHQSSLSGGTTTVDGVGASLRHIELLGKAKSNQATQEPLPRLLIELHTNALLSKDRWLNALEVVELFPGDASVQNTVCLSSSLQQRLVESSKSGWLSALKVFSGTSKKREFHHQLTKACVQGALWEAAIEVCPPFDFRDIDPVLQQIESDRRWLSGLRLLDRVKYHNVRSLPPRVLLAILFSMSKHAAENTAVDVVVDLHRPREQEGSSASSGQKGPRPPSTGGPQQQIRLVMATAETGKRQQHMISEISPELWKPALTVFSRLPRELAQRGDLLGSLDELLRTTAQSDTLWESSLHVFNGMRRANLKPSSHSLLAFRESISRHRVDSPQLTEDPAPQTPLGTGNSREAKDAMKLLQDSLLRKDWVRGLWYLSKLPPRFKEADEARRAQVRLLHISNFRSPWQVATSLLNGLEVKVNEVPRLPSNVFIAALNTISKSGRWQETIRLVGMANQYTAGSSAAVQYCVLIAKACRKSGRWEEALRHYRQSYDTMSTQGTSAALFALMSETITACTLAGFSLKEVHFWLRRAMMDSNSKKQEGGAVVVGVGGSEDEDVVVSSTALGEDEVGESSATTLRLWIALLSAQGRVEGDSSSWSKALQLLATGIKKDPAILEAVDSQALSAAVDLCARQGHWLESVRLLEVQGLVGVPVTRHAVHQVLECLERSRNNWYVACELYHMAQKGGKVDLLVRDALLGCLLANQQWTKALSLASHWGHFTDYTLHKILSHGASVVPLSRQYQAATLLKSVGSGQGDDTRTRLLLGLSQRLLENRRTWKEACLLCDKLLSPTRKGGSNLSLKPHQQMAALTACCQVAQALHMGRFQEGYRCFQSFSTKLRGAPPPISVLDAALCRSHSEPKGGNEDEVTEMLIGFVLAANPRQLAAARSEFPQPYSQAVESALQFSTDSTLL